MQSKRKKKTEKLENNLENSKNLRKYKSFKNDLELIYNHIAKGVTLRRKMRLV